MPSPCVNAFTFLAVPGCVPSLLLLEGRVHRVVLEQQLQQHQAECLECAELGMKEWKKNSEKDLTVWFIWWRSCSVNKE